VKNLAKLALVFSLCFAVVLAAATGLRFLSLRVDWVRSFPQTDETILSTIITSVHWALSFTLYISLLLGLSYAARNHYFQIMTMLTIGILAVLYSFGISLVLQNWAGVPPEKSSVKTLGENGIILSNSLNRNETAIILLRKDPLGPRVIAIPDRPLQFQEAGSVNVNFGLPPVPFGNDTPWSLKNISIDIRLNAEMLAARLQDRTYSFFIYTGALVCLLVSLGFTVRISAWPLANLFLGALTFRGIIALETFFNSVEMQDVFSSYLKNIVPVTWIVPVIFAGFSVLIHLYSVLVYIAQRRTDDDY
jgi:hypothetical protein